MSFEKPPVMFWLVAVVAVLWNAIGCWNYIMQSNPDVVAQMPEVYQVLIGGRPAWATGAFAVSVFGGVLGSILLILRRGLAVPVFGVSLLGTLVIFYFTVRVLGLEPATGSAVLMSVALVFFAMMAKTRGWLK